MTDTQPSPSTCGRWKRRPLSSQIAAQIGSLVRDAAGHIERRDIESAWRLLEDAHILSQPWVRPHLRVHVAMVSLGWSLRDRAEVVGQIGRLIVAGPASALGRYPVGNTGRANVSAFRPMPIRDDLASLLTDADQPGADVDSRHARDNRNSGDHCDFGPPSSQSNGGALPHATHYHHEWVIKRHNYTGLVELNHHEGQFGDLKFFKVPYTEYPRFFYKEGFKRDVTGFQPRAAMQVDDFVCNYGRKSNTGVRCTSIKNTNASKTSGGVFMGNLVQLNVDFAVTGDSGGPWYLNGKAYGIHQGNIGNFDAFTPVSTAVWFWGAEILTPSNA